MNNFRSVYRPHSRSTQTRIADKFNELVSVLSKKKILLRRVMVRPRTVLYPKYLAERLGRSETAPFTMSQVAGHGSFVLLAISYLESDFMNLRLYATSGIAMSILFQYYRETPLWLPISWNCLFMTINFGMILILLQEKREAEDIPIEQRHLYSSLFQQHGMKPVEFLQLMEIAKRVEKKKGDKIIGHGDNHHDVYVLQSGSCVVKRDGDVIGHIRRFQFAGEMSFLRWQNNRVANASAGDEESLGVSLDGTSSPVHKLIKIYKHYVERPLHRDSSVSTSTVSEGTPQPEDQRIKLLYDQHSEIMNGVIGSADVVCMEDCVLYSWNFIELHDLIATDSRLGLTVEMTMSSDLNNKFQSQHSTHQTRKYNQILSGALLGDYIGKQTRNSLERRRLDMGVSDHEHLETMHRFGWTKEEYENGVKSTKTAAVKEYKSKLYEVLRLKQITADDYARLRHFRVSHDMNSHTHVDLLQELGWTLDEFEAGHKTAAVVAAIDVPPSHRASASPN